VLRRRRTAADVVRGIRNGARLHLTYGAGGQLQVRVENTIALQQPAKPDYSNSVTQLDGGWPAYEFGDGASSTTGILRREGRESSVRLSARPAADTPNRFAIEFQDQFNEYQHDSLSVVDVDDVRRTGQEITGPLAVFGIPNFSQAGRILKFNLDRSIEGNTYVEFDTSVRAVGLQPGDIIAITYLKEGFTRQPFRILKVAPRTNFRTARITAQIHVDGWYSDTNDVSALGVRRPPEAGLGLPRPLLGSVIDANGDVQFEITETPRGEADGGSTVDATVGFTRPPAVTTTAIGLPLLSLAATVGGGGTLAGDQTLYYAVSGVDTAGDETRVSFVVRAAIPPGGSTNSVTLNSLRFSPGTSTFNVYRGPSPSQLFRIASSQAIATQFTDTGLPKQLAAPPDPNYHHANFSWRLELVPESAASIHTPATVGNGTLQMTVDAYRGMTVRITRGKGAGQERSVSSNTATTLTLASAWTIEPDAASFFVVAESAWHFGASGENSPVQFEIPNRTGAIVHITGRAANVNDKESPEELALVTRWTIGGAGALGLDAAPPPKPNYGISVSPFGGVVLISAIAFPTLVNTRGVTAATITLHYFNELDGQPAQSLSTAIGTTDTTVSLAPAGSAAVGSFLQIDDEVLRVDAVLGGGTQYTVTRAMHGSTAASHSSGAVIYPLARKVVIGAFPRDFFGSPASGSWHFPVSLPDVRIASTEMHVTNALGNSPVEAFSVTQSIDHGMRTLSGGEFVMTVEGFLAIENGASPDLVVESAHSVRDVFAVVRQAPAGAPVDIRLKHNGVTYTTLSIAAGAIVSNSVNGFFLPPLAAGARISLDVTSVGSTVPGSDLTVIIRL
ncbi:MAG: phage tail protein, partial [Bryobacteraceae bacterium]